MFTRKVHSFNSISLLKVPGCNPASKKHEMFLSSTPSMSAPSSSFSLFSARSLLRASIYCLSMGFPLLLASSFAIYFFFYNSRCFYGPNSLKAENRSKAWKPFVSNKTFLIISQLFSPYAMISRILAVS